MLIFHEGLPGSGKSFAAMVDHIGPALKKGRKVFAYIEGLNHDKIAEACELPAERVRELLYQIEREQVPQIFDHVENDALVVIDELQNFWPNGRAKLSPQITQFVTEHRHRGLDVLCMGQSLADCHTLWRRRIENKIVFMKLDALGSSTRYTWTLEKQTRPDRWEKTSSGTGTYDAKWFGCYASHTEGTENTEHYKDARAVIWNSKLFRFGLPAVLVLAALSLWYVVGIFRSGDFGVSAKPQRAQPQRASAEPVHVEETTYKVLPDGRHQIVSTNQATQGGATQQPAAGLMPTGHVAKLSEDFRPRLQAVILSATPRVIIEWRDGAGRIVEQMDARDLEAFGWHVMLTPTGSIALLTNGSASHVVTAWPLEEARGTVPETTNERIRAGA